MEEATLLTKRKPSSPLNSPGVEKQKMGLFVVQLRPLNGESDGLDNIISQNDPTERANRNLQTLKLLAQNKIRFRPFDR